MSDQTDLLERIVDLLEEIKGVLTSIDSTLSFSGSGSNLDEIQKDISAINRDVSNIVLSAKSNILDKVSLLEIGVSEHVTKPFSPRKLLARVRAALRRSTRVSVGDAFVFDDVSVSFSTTEVTCGGKPVSLTAQEFKTLKFMIQNAERVISRKELLSEAWGYQNYPCTRTVDNHILGLRHKLEKNPTYPVHFRTVHRMGYKFVP